MVSFWKTNLPISIAFVVLFSSAHAKEDSIAPDPALPKLDNLLLFLDKYKPDEILNENNEGPFALTYKNYQETNQEILAELQKLKAANWSSTNPKLFAQQVEKLAKDIKTQHIIYDKLTDAAYYYKDAEKRFLQLRSVDSTEKDLPEFIYKITDYLNDTECESKTAACVDQAARARGNMDSMVICLKNTKDEECRLKDFLPKAKLGSPLSYADKLKLIIKIKEEAATILAQHRVLKSDKRKDPKAEQLLAERELLSSKMDKIHESVLLERILYKKSVLDDDKLEKFNARLEEFTKNFDLPLKDPGNSKESLQTIVENLGENLRDNKELKKNKKVYDMLKKDVFTKIVNDQYDLDMAKAEIQAEPEKFPEKSYAEKIVSKIVSIVSYFSKKTEPAPEPEPPCHDGTLPRQMQTQAPKGVATRVLNDASQCADGTDNFEKGFGHSDVIKSFNNPPIHSGCIAAALNSYPKKGVRYLSCPTMSYTAQPCVTTNYVREVHAAFANVTSCLDLDPKNMLPMLSHESGFHINVQGPTVDIGIGQLTPPAIRDVNEHIDEYLDEMKNKDCQSSFKSVRRADDQSKNLCALADVPENPLKNMLYAGIVAKRNQAMIQHALNKTPMCRGVKTADSIVARIDKIFGAGTYQTYQKSFNSILEVLGYNGGAPGAVAMLSTYLKRLEAGKVTKPFPDYFNFAVNPEQVEEIGAARKDCDSLKTDEIVDFPVYARLCQKYGTKGYATRVFREKNKLEALTGNTNSCGPENYLTVFKN